MNEITTQKSKSNDIVDAFFNLKELPRVENILSNKGNSIANQYRLIFKGLEVFQSYDSIIAVIDYYNNKTYLDVNYWNYSTTTSRYRNIFLGESTKETKKKIKQGQYRLVNLN